MLAISIGVWALYPYLPENPIIAQPFSWQFIFFAGFAIGYYWDAIVELWRKLNLRTRKLIGWTFATTFLVTAVVNYMLVFNHEIGGAFGQQLANFHHEIEQHFNKDRLAFWRIILGTVWFWGLFFLVRRFESFIVKRFGTFLLGFGMNSLYIYTISATVVFFINLFVAPPGFDNVFLNLLLSLFSLGIVWLAYKTKFLMKIIPR